MGDFGMTNEKPGPITAPAISTANGLGSGSLGDDMGSESDWHKIPGNPDKGMLGGDNNPDPPLHAIAGNPPVGSVMDHDYGWPGDSPLYEVRGNCSREEVKSYFRGGSDALGMDGRDNGT